MKRIVLWAASTLTAVVLLFGYHTSTAGALDAAATPVTPVTGSASTSSGTSSGGTSSGGTSSGGTGDDTTTQPDPSASDSTDSGSTDSGSTDSGSTGSGSSSSTVTGDVAQTRWGPVQVELTVSGGKITNVSVVQYPNNNGRDVEINDYALPILVQETLDQQGADIDMVSGATVTSDGYIGSLQSALDKAGL